MSWVSIWVHLVFSTKYGEPLMSSKEIRYKVFRHIKQNAAKKGIHLDCVNGYTNHAHCLISLGKEQSISQVAQLIKGESSFWINEQQIIPELFMWQDDYWAAGVCESRLKRIRNYIHNQEAHHRNQSFSDETKLFMRKYGWVYMKEDRNK